MGAVLRIETPKVFAPLCEPARYKGAYGGRGSGKSHNFAGMVVEDSLRFPGLRTVCVREIQKSLKQSAKRLIEDKLEAFSVGPEFDVLESEIRTPGGGVVIFEGMQDHTAESIKSLEAFDRAWVEEAHTLSDTSLTLLRPTIRKDGSELWFSWNPRFKHDPVDKLLRGEGVPSNAIVVRANWSDNPYFPMVLEQERQDDLVNRPEQYPHIWEGDYRKITEGAYYALDLIRARQQGRIGNVAADPLQSYRAFWDIGGTGAKADACVIWIAQFLGREIRVLDYYEAQGQTLSAHINWLRSSGYANAYCVLPHDGRTNDRVYDVSFESALMSAGFDVEVIPNQGRGAAKMRIEAARRLFGSMWFNEATTEAGREALGAYHEKRDEDRQIGLGPEHDWASHGADAFGLMCVAYGDGPRVKKAPIDAYHESESSGSEHSWMGV